MEKSHFFLWVVLIFMIMEIKCQPLTDNFFKKSMKTFALSLKNNYT